MQSMFGAATLFNGDISGCKGWHKKMFSGFIWLPLTHSLLCLLITGNVSNVQVFRSMFWKASSFSVDISSWQLSSAVSANRI